MNTVHRVNPIFRIVFPALTKNKIGLDEILIFYTIFKYNQIALLYNTRGTILGTLIIFIFHSCHSYCHTKKYKGKKIILFMLHFVKFVPPDTAVISGIILVYI